MYHIIITVAESALIIRRYDNGDFLESLNIEILSAPPIGLIPIDYLVYNPKSTP